MQKMYSKILCFCLLLLSPAILFAQGDLTPSANDMVVITGASSANVNGVATTFNGTIDGSAGTLGGLTIAGSVTGDPVIILKNVVTPTLDVEAGAEVRFELNGGNEANDLGKIDNKGNLFMGGYKFKFSDTANAVNDGFFTDSTASLRIVEGAGALTMGIIEGDETHNSEQAHLKGIAVISRQDEGVTFIWQQRVQSLYWMDRDTIYIPSHGSPIIQCDYYTGHAGEYRFRVMVERENVMTSLISQTSVEAKIHHNVILPAVVGATTEPGAGIHEILDGERFDFWLYLDKDYNESVPVVTTNSGDTLTLNNEGAYSIRNISGETTIRIDSVKPNGTVSNTEIDHAGINVRVLPGQIEVSLVQPEWIKIYTFDGILQKTVNAPSGNTTITMTPGLYILQAGRKTIKFLLPSE